MKNGIRVCAALLAATAGLSVANAADGPWEVRLRAVNLAPADKSTSYAPLGIPTDAIHINSKWLPDVDFEYFFSPNWSSELILTYPQTQRVIVEKSALGGPVDIGSFKHLPPVLTIKYNFLPNSSFQPYIGAGLNLTLISSVNLAVPTVGKLTLDSSSVGAAVQAGFDYKVADQWYVNADLKWVMINSDVKFNGTKISKVNIDPFLFGVGVGYRFGSK